MNERLTSYDEKMNKSVKFLGEELQSIRAGRANPHVLDKLRVDYYGTPTPIQQLANVSVPEARMIQIAPWDKKLIKDIEKAILASDIGITPSNDGTNIRLIFPELTEERRKQLSKKLKGSDVSEDEIKDLEEELQKLTDRYVKEVDKSVEEKSKEIMTI